MEGLGELPYVDELVREIRSSGIAYPEGVGALTAGSLHVLARGYLTLAAAHRRTNKPFFVDKMPSNWLHIGLIRLVFPAAHIIDARRHPLDCCLSNYRQYYQGGHEFTYSLADLGKTYRAYLRLVAHFEWIWDKPLVRVVHEQLIDDPERTIRDFLAGLELDFQERCLRFHESDRAVNTPSALQVRRPITSARAGRWRHFSPWIAPLTNALGRALDSYPDAPFEDRAG